MSLWLQDKAAPTNVPNYKLQPEDRYLLDTKTTKQTAVPFGKAHSGNQHQQEAIAFEEYLEDTEESSEPGEPGDGGTKILYGKQGFLQFLENLYVLFKEKDKLKINFYFTIRDLIIDYCEKMAEMHESASSQNDTRLQSQDKHELASAAFDGLLPARKSAVLNDGAGRAQPNDAAADEKDGQPSPAGTPIKDPCTLVASNKTSKQCRDKSIIASMAPPSSRVTEMKSMMTKHAQELANSRGGQKKEQTVWCNSYRPASDLKCLSKSGISQT